MKKRSVFLTVFAFLMVGMMMFSACAPTGSSGTGTTVAETVPETLPENTGDQTPAEKKVTTEYSVIGMGPTFVTWNENGQRQKEISFTNDTTFVYIYNTQKVLSAIQISANGETMEFECQYDDNGIPTKAVANSEDMGIESILFEYDSNKKMTKMALCAQDEIPVIANYYDENGALSKSELYDTSEESPCVSATVLSEYANGNVSVLKMMMEDMLMAQLDFHYDADGQLVKMETKNAVDENGTLEAYEYIELTHTETSHTVKNYWVEESEGVLYSSETYDASWNLTEALYYNEDGEVEAKKTVSRDENGNRVTEWFELDETELKLSGKTVESFGVDGSLNWIENYIQNEGGEIVIQMKTVYTATGSETTYYDSEGKEESKRVESCDEQGNALLQYYEKKESGEGLYLFESSKYNVDGALLEQHWYDEAGTVISKTLRREGTGGGYFLDYYFLNENNELVLEYSEEYDADGELITTEVSDPEENTPTEESGIKNDGANTEAGWGPIIQ